jgi:L-asparaginase
MEETGFLLDLVHQSDKPVILTGAQKTADQSDTDGPRNLTDAVRVAASSDARGCGALIVFAGLIHAPQRVRKHHTLALDPYHSSDTGPLGHVIGGTTRLVSRPVRPAPLPMPGPAFDRTRVDVVCCYPGTDATLAEAAVNAGAQAVVIAGTGAGNGNHALVEWTRGATASGVTVGLATRVAEGPVVPIYGNGGGVDLLRAGAVCLGGLPLFHGRLLLAMLIGTGSPVDAATLADYI